MNKCFFCGVAVPDDRYCEGCTTSTCETCGAATPRAKKHDVHMHLPKAKRPS